MKDFYRENKFILIGFVLSFFHWTIATIYCVALLWYLKKEQVRGAIKIMIILGIRTNLGLSIAAKFGAGGVIKLLVIFYLAFYILINAHPKNKDRLNNLFGLLCIYLFSNIITLLFISTFPVTGFFKLISYAIPFYAVVKGIGDDDKYDYIEYMLNWFAIILVCSIIAIPFGRFNYVNGDFQGILNHPNTFGVFGAVFAGLLAYQFSIGKKQGKDKIWFYLGGLDLLLLLLSRSRTGFFSAIICILIAFWTTREMSLNKKIFTGLVIGFMIILYINFSLHGREKIERFIHKRGETEFFQSRQEMRILFEEKYKSSPWLGTGFLIPFYKGAKDMSLHFNLIAEPGNLYYAVVGDSGIIGGIFFIIYICYIFLCSDKQKKELATIPIIISIGEVAFFSTNNIASWYYVMFGICLAKDN